MSCSLGLSIKAKDFIPNPTPAIKTHPKGCIAFDIASTSIVLIYSAIQKDIIQNDNILHYTLTPAT